MAVDLTTYQGNAGLGLGGNANIPAVADDRALGILNNTIRDILLQDNEKNVKLFQQKIKDRDDLNQLILNNQVSTGDILPEYQPVFDEGRRRVEDAFMSWRGNPNDTAGFRKYQGAVQDLRDAAAHAQVNTAQIRRLESEKAKEILPRKQAEYQKWIDQQKKQPF